MTTRLSVWTDGSCSKTEGGWAWATESGEIDYGYALGTTNQRMELTAALQASTSFNEPILIVSDSKYVVDCFLQKWYVKWKQRNWKNFRGEPVKNKDLWEQLIENVLSKDVNFKWVKGHSDDPMNDLVDELAAMARECKTEYMRGI